MVTKSDLQQKNEVVHEMLRTMIFQTFFERYICNVIGMTEAQFAFMQTAHRAQLALFENIMRASANQVLDLGLFSDDKKLETKRNDRIEA